MNPKRTSICLELKKTLISVLYINIDLTKTIKLLLGIRLNLPYFPPNLNKKGGEKEIFAETQTSFKIQEGRFTPMLLTVSRNPPKIFLTVYLTCTWRLLICVYYIVQNVTHLYKDTGGPKNRKCNLF